MQALSSFLPLYTKSFNSNYDKMKKILLLIGLLITINVHAQTLSLATLKSFVTMNLTEINSELTNRGWKSVKINGAIQDESNFYMTWELPINLPHSEQKFYEVIKIVKSSKLPNQVFYEVYNNGKNTFTDLIKMNTSFIRENLEHGEISTYYKDQKFAYRLTFDVNRMEIDVWNLKDFLIMEKIKKSQNK